MDTSQDFPNPEHPGWYLEGVDDDGSHWWINLQGFPFSIGRSQECALQLAAPDVSRFHAEIYRSGEQLWLKDHGSTNGTFVNYQRLQEDSPVNGGDIIHFGTRAFRLIRRERDAPSLQKNNQSDEGTSHMMATVLPETFVSCEAEFQQLLDNQAVAPHYQPLVRLSDNRLIGYELLGRGASPDLASSPGELLRIARALGKEIELSLLFRNAGIRQIATQQRGYIFFNTLPVEMELTFLGQSLMETRRMAPQLPLVMEVHESVITHPHQIRGLRSLLRELDIRLAYDDFGAGQARLVELMEVPPDCLKFDIGLIRNIHRRPPKSLMVLSSLVKMAKDIGVKTLAEGIEHREELDVCRQLGFDFGQGFLLGKPSRSLDEHQIAQDVWS